jgi:hypothetical protein
MHEALGSIPITGKNVINIILNGIIIVAFPLKSEIRKKMPDI